MNQTFTEATFLTDTNVLSERESSVIKTLLYFDLFNYPLATDEIKKFCRADFSEHNLDETLYSLLEKQLLFSKNNYFLLANDFKKVQQRIEDNKRAQAVMKKAKFFSKLISQFPYVRAVFISGSLSKGVMHKDSDVDYFIITAPNRLWLCRTLLVLFKKIFLFNSHKYFCVNYFVDENHLRINDKNIFTATEIASLIPMVNHDLFKLFIERNNWVYGFLPNAGQTEFASFPLKRNYLKTFFEKLFSGKIGNYFETTSLKKTVSYWQKKYRYHPEIDFTDTIRARSEVAKYHPNKFQHKVLKKLEERISLFEKQTGYCFSDSEKMLVT
jgi:hypothetical protein